MQLFNGVDGIAFDTTGAFVYVTNFNNNTVALCNVNANGTLSACAVTGSGFNNPASIRLNSGGTFAYISNYGGNTISSCAVNATTRVLTGCTTTANGNLASPDGLSAIINGTMYVANNAGANNQIISFSVNNATLSNFTVAANATSGAPGFNNPDAIDFNAAQTFAYISNFAGPPYVVSICQLNADATLGTCTSTTGNGTFNVPHGVAIQ